jgi:hypothetical protein
MRTHYPTQPQTKFRSDGHGHPNALAFGQLGLQFIGLDMLGRHLGSLDFGLMELLGMNSGSIAPAAEGTFVEVKDLNNRLQWTAIGDQFDHLGNESRFLAESKEGRILGEGHAPAFATHPKGMTRMNPDIARLGLASQRAIEVGTKMLAGVHGRSSGCAIPRRRSEPVFFYWSSFHSPHLMVVLPPAQRWHAVFETFQECVKE